MPYWTAHPTGLMIDAPDFEPDPTKGHYWKMEDEGFRYRECLPKLWDIIGTRNFVWCFLELGRNERLTETDEPYDEWELNVPRSEVLAFVRGTLWHDIIWSRSDEWDTLLIYDELPPREENIQALVSVPLPTGSATCLGLLPIKNATKPQQPKRRLSPKIPKLTFDGDNR
jgi:hypothetical protein